jgi:hypothetical protein
MWEFTNAGARVPVVPENVRSEKKGEIWGTLVRGTEKDHKLVAKSRGRDKFVISTGAEAQCRDLRFVIFR